MARRFRVGICTDQNMPWDKTVERWQLFERLGFESAWLCDHLVQPSRPNGPYFEAWSLLAGLAARTEKIRVGVLVTSNTFRYPQVLAKKDTSSFDGTYYQLRGARSRPDSVQKPRPPLVLGAFGPRMLKIVAKYADTWNAFGTPEEMRERNQMLDDFCREIGRDPDTLDRSLYYWVPKTDADPWVSKDAFFEVINPYIEAGVNQFILDQPRDDQLDMLDWVAADALPRLAREKPRTVEPVAAAKIDTSDWKKPQDHL